MSDAKSTGSSQVEVAIAIMTAVGSIVGSTVGVLLGYWIKHQFRNSRDHDEENNVPAAASNMLTELETRVDALEKSQQSIRPCCCRDSQDQIEPTNSSGDGGTSSDS